MKLDFISHDFMIVASVLLLSAIFNKTLLSIVGQYEQFATAADADKFSAKDVLREDTWVNFFRSKAFWMPGFWVLLILFGLFIWLLTYVFKVSKKYISPGSNF